MSSTSLRVLVFTGLVSCIALHGAESRKTKNNEDPILHVAKKLKTKENNGISALQEKGSLSRPPLIRDLNWDTPEYSTECELDWSAAIDMMVWHAAKKRRQ